MTGDLKTLFITSFENGDVNFMKKDSASASVMLKGKFKKKSTDLFFGKAFYTNVNNFKESQNCSDEYGMNYENKIYELISNKLQKTSPNFVEYIGSIYLTREDDGDVFSIIEKRLHEHPTNCKRINRNIITILFTKFMGKTKSFYDTVKQKNFTDENLRVVMTQLILTLIGMYTEKLIHNDLHLGNILVEKGDFTNLTYNIGGVKVYIRETPYKIFLFDWDMSYSGNVGDNHKLGTICEKYGVCSQYNVFSDLFTVCCTVVHLEETGEYYFPMFNRFVERDVVREGSFKSLVNALKKDGGYFCRYPHSNRKGQFKIADKFYKQLGSNESYLNGLYKSQYVQGVLFGSPKK